MITLTDSAVLQIRILEDEKSQAGQMLRIFVEAGGCSGFEYGMSFDNKKKAICCWKVMGFPF